MSSYQEQYNRVKRFLRRIETFDKSQEDYEDDFWAFFQNCWHLKDWLKNDRSIPSHIASRIEDDIKSYDALMICADLANRSKHYTLTRKRKDAKISGRNIVVVLNEAVGSDKSESSMSWQYIITTDDGTSYNALVIARQAVREWKIVIRNYGLNV